MKYDTITVAELRTIGHSDDTVRRLVIGLQKRLEHIGFTIGIDMAIGEDETIITN